MRKEITTDSFYKEFQIQVFNPAGVYIPILERAYKLINYTLSEHSQVLLNGFCATYPIEAAGRVPRDLTNNTFLAFLESYRRHLWEEGYDPMIIWCREQKNQYDIFGNPSSPHWHFVVLLNGNKIRKLRTHKINELWNLHLGIPLDCHGYIDHCKLGTGYPGYMMNRNNLNSIARCFYAISYLAKCTTKEHTPPGVNKFDSSQIPNH
jgi:hypothetical protein